MGGIPFPFELDRDYELEKQEDCYCVCHTPFSSCAVCKHCEGSLKVLKRQDIIKAEKAIDKFESWVQSNTHDLGELGEFIRISYVNNAVEQLKKDLGIIDE